MTANRITRELQQRLSPRTLFEPPAHHTTRSHAHPQPPPRSRARPRAPSPQWFEELGAFEYEANIPIFVDWCLKAVELFGKRIYFWATFNEPTVRGGGT